jgi:hypothetical protein
MAFMGYPCSKINKFLIKERKTMKNLSNIRCVRELLSYNGAASDENRFLKQDYI